MKTKFPATQAQPVADDLAKALMPACERITVAGSLRRRKPEVGDIELLYIPRFGPGRRPGELVDSDDVNQVDLLLKILLDTGVLEKRLNVKGAETWGPQIKLARHVPSGIPVDLFSTGATSWWNYLVCRTGPAESNTRIATEARQRGWKWEPYSDGFSKVKPELRNSGEEGPSGTDRYAVACEKDVFEFVGLPYGEPWERE